MKSIAFICVGNACRSQMAEGFARALAGDNIEIYSAGSHPAGFVAPEAIVAMTEKGIDISSHYSKGVDELPKLQFDCVVTMDCGDSCPTITAKQRLDWPIPDPIGRGPEFFHEVCETIEAKVRSLLKTL